MGHLLTSQPKGLFANQFSDLGLVREISPLVGREVERPPREQADELVAELRDPVARLRADRVERVEVPEC